MKLIRNIILVGSIVGILAITSEVIVRKRLDLVSVVVVNTDLLPRTKIEKDHLRIKKVSSHFVGKDKVSNIDAVLGQYVKHQHTLYKGQPLLLDTIETVDAAVDKAALLLNEDERLYALKRDVVGSLGASLEVGSIVDIAVQNKKNEEYGVIVSGVRIIGVKDRNGKEMEKGKVPHVVLIALHEKDVNTVLKAESDGTIILLGRGVSNEP